MLKPGMTISDRYEIIDIVGSGGMADVYKARDQRLNRFVAIKVLKTEYSNDKSFVNKFRGEAQSAAGLSHPNIVNVYDVGDDNGLHFIVMELVEGITLKRFIERKGKLDIKEAVGIGIQIAQGMDAAHENHIVHRDIKPQNIIISRDGKVKVTDFGIAKATNSNTITSNAMGSVHYLSPEQARGGYSDEKSDIYSLGVTLYEMLSGKVPFSGENTVSVALLHIQQDAVPLRELDPEIPVSIDKIVQKCMQKRPERRYHSASELIADLKRAITNPDGDFVQIPAFVTPDSPTINISSDDLNKIKSGAFLDDDFGSTINMNTGKIVEEDDDEDLDSVDAKVEKVFMIGSIVVAAIIVLVIIFAIGWFWSNGNKKPSTNNKPSVTASVSPTQAGTPAPTDNSATFPMPKVLGMTKEDAEKTIKDLDPTAFVKYNDDTYSEEYDAGQVMKQYPNPDNPVKKGTNIVLTVSLGSEELTVPDVSKLTEATAKLKLTEMGLKVTSDYQPSDSVAKGRVVSTNPPVGTSVKVGDAITITVSDGSANAQVPVPNLLGSTVNTAKTTLANASLVLGTVTYETSTQGTPVGQITYQSFSTQQTAAPGTPIDIKVSCPGITFDKNPFADYGLNPATNYEFIFTLTQAGVADDILDQFYNASNMPKAVPITTTSNADGVVTLVILDPNGSTINTTYKWPVKFN
jgi:Serine/threonine protein kinase